MLLDICVGGLMMGVVLLVRACDSDLAWLDYIGCLDHGVADLVREVG